MSADRLLGVTRLAWGVALLAAPQLLMRRLPGALVDPRAVAYARVLGARQVAEELALHRHPEPRWRWAGATIDAVHGLTALALLRAAPDRRQLLTANALSAGALSLAGAWAAIAQRRRADGAA